ncbi:hypothetical protein EMOOHJMP_00179 [Microcystis phage MaAM05]|jgi:hypothetical protein|nr:hypothetical protein EMOOHJMP_00179 [Microcystis phage MaAM05]
MLIVLPSTPTTENASQWLNERNVPHQVIPIPESLGYKTGSDVAIYIEGNDQQGVPMELTKARFVVMRVFKDFKL